MASYDKLREDLANMRSDDEVECPDCIGGEILIMGQLPGRYCDKCKGSGSLPKDPEA